MEQTIAKHMCNTFAAIQAWHHYYQVKELLYGHALCHDMHAKGSDMADTDTHKCEEKMKLTPANEHMMYNLSKVYLSEARDSAGHAIRGADLLTDCQIWHNTWQICIVCEHIPHLHAAQHSP